MYRIVCESYKNYVCDFLPDHTEEYRYKVIEYLRLIIDLKIYQEEKSKNSIDYQKLEHLIYLLKENSDKYPRMKSFLWSLESRSIYGVNYNVLTEEDFDEAVKLIDMFLKMAYWH